MSQCSASACSRAQAITAVRSSPYAGPWPASYSSTRAAPRSRSRAAPMLFPRAACVRPTQTCARPCHKSRSSSGPAFQRASNTSCAANGRPSCTSLRARLTVSTGGSTSSGTGSTPGAPYGRGRPSASRGRPCRGRPASSRSRPRTSVTAGTEPRGPEQVPSSFIHGTSGPLSIGNGNEAEDHVGWSRGASFRCLSARAPTRRTFTDKQQPRSGNRWLWPPTWTRRVNFDAPRTRTVDGCDDESRRRGAVDDLA